jgi:hypothetical protein
MKKYIGAILWGLAIVVTIWMAWQYVPAKSTAPSVNFIIVTSTPQPAAAQAPAAPAPLVEVVNEITNIQNNAPAAAAPAVPEKGSATNPLNPSELVEWMESVGMASFTYDGRPNGIMWQRIQVNGVYADLSSLSSRWIGPVPFVTIVKCESSAFQQLMVGSYCFSPFR